LRPIYATRLYGGDYDCLMKQYLHFLIDTTTLFGFDIQNWLLAVAAVLVIWVLILIRGAK